MGMLKTIFKLKTGIPGGKIKQTHFTSDVDDFAERKSWNGQLDSPVTSRGGAGGKGPSSVAGGGAGGRGPRLRIGPCGVLTPLPLVYVATLERWV